MTASVYSNYWYGFTRSLDTHSFYSLSLVHTHTLLSLLSSVPSLYTEKKKKLVLRVRSDQWQSVLVRDIERKSGLRAFRFFSQPVVEILLPSAQFLLSEFND